jgi:hypothetical protein
MLSQEKKPVSSPHIKPMLSITPEEYMQDRVVYKINTYTKLSRQHKLRYELTSIIAIVCAASVPALINYGWNNALPTALSLIVTILISMEKLFHFREHWRNYDEIAAFLRSEQLQYQTLSGVYKEKASRHDEAFRLFVRRIEDGIKDERSATIEMRTRENV